MNKINDKTFKLPRLFVDAPLAANGEVTLTKDQSHHLGTVLRRSDNDEVRLFNGADGEWLGALQFISKKQAIVTLLKQLRVQPNNPKRVHLLFPPIKKQRLEWLIEKAVELGVTDFHPIITQNTDKAKIKPERMMTQIFEAAEQCERLEIPKLSELTKLDYALSKWGKNTPILACLERFNAKPIKDVHSAKNDYAILIGPEGGFTDIEKERIAKYAIAVDLGENILRCETAAIKALVLAESLNA